MKEDIDMFYFWLIVSVNSDGQFPWKIKMTKQKKNSFEYIYISTKRKPKCIETDQGKDVLNSVFANFLNNNEIKHSSRKSPLGALFAERFNRTIRDLFKKPVFERGDGNWIDVVSVKTKQYNNRVHTSTTLTPIQASLKRNEGYIYKNLLDKRKKTKPKFQVDNLFRRADSKKTFSKRDSFNWSYNLYKITENKHDKIPSFHIDKFPER